ncbi:conserved hypothetical protein [Culex quinquefasciatus]|uniref:DUF4806 domain-containing protein n=1 Tax=Culex quinquefasciatus TaxID=7176 RepID=B0W8W6_CULQU|nr:conserved hypothetical protein [Culex quinquefasciatus]|eukprot:XP_001845181.1 conserved hypothetical protein [Culex quinquefasciatus]
MSKMAKITKMAKLIKMIKKSNRSKLLEQKMNFYSIVQTFEDDEFMLSVLPTKWTIRGGWTGEASSVEGQDVCFWPKNIAGHRLLEKTKKDPELAVEKAHLQEYRCKIKRTGFQTYNEAVRKLKVMETTPDTDDFDPPRTSAKGNGAVELFRAIQASGGSKTKQIQTITVPEPENPQLNLIISLLHGLEEKIDSLQTSYNTLKDDVGPNSRFSVPHECQAEFRKASTSNQKVKLKKFSLSPVNSLDELKSLEESCKDEEFVMEAIRSIGRIFGKNQQTGNGATVCLRLVDSLFTREFLTKCSWTGLSRTRSEDGSIITKIGFQRFERVIDLFYQAVSYSDPVYPVEECNNFLRRCLQNAKQRFEEVKGIRNTSSRKRRKKIADVNATHDATGSSDGDITENESNGEENGCGTVKVEQPIIQHEEIVEEYVVLEEV